MANELIELSLFLALGGALGGSLRGGVVVGTSGFGCGRGTRGGGFGLELLSINSWDDRDAFTSSESMMAALQVRFRFCLWFM